MISAYITSKINFTQALNQNQSKNKSINSFHYTCANSSTLDPNKRGEKWNNTIPILVKPRTTLSISFICSKNIDGKEKTATGTVIIISSIFHPLGGHPSIITEQSRHAMHIINRPSTFKRVELIGYIHIYIYLLMRNRFTNGMIIITWYDGATTSGKRGRGTRGGGNRGRISWDWWNRWSS